ncbi:MAG: (Fe-S)-binding protein [Betaproteobacteria bacterium]|nr:(Fe-S)-binding protein [Betaproteobacteria bacterium]
METIADPVKLSQARPRVGFLIGFASVRLLEDAGCQVDVPIAQTCCGQPGYNAGDQRVARDLALQWLQLFEAFDYVVVPSGSCAGMIRQHYPDLFRNDPDLRIRMQNLSERTWELSSFLVEVCGMQKPHDACSGLRELGVQHQPRLLLRSMPGLELKEMQDSRACCGFGGTFAVKYGAISASIADEKIAQIEQTGASCVVMGDLGCMLHLEGRLRRCGDTRIRVMHVAEVLAAQDRPAPEGM